MKKKISSNGAMKEQALQENLNGVLFHDQIACKAYELYQKRGEIHGHDLEDWFAAESLLQAELIAPQPAARVSPGKSLPRRKNSRSTHAGA